MFEYLKKFKINFPERKCYQLIDKIYHKDNLNESWKKVKANKGSAGIDKVTIHDFGSQKKLHFVEIQRAIKYGKYKPTPAKRKFIPKKNGKLRPLGIPTVKDRIIQQAAKNVLEPIFETKFLENSFGFRPNKSAHQAISAVKTYINEGYKFVIDADIKAFFDDVDHKVMMELISKEISDGKVLNLIESWLTSGFIVDNKFNETIQGTPQGGVISPLLANIYLHELDKELNSLVNIRFVRYADDFVVLCKTKWMTQQVMTIITEIMNKLKLELNNEKTKIVDVNENSFKFLGVTFKRNRGRLKVNPSKEAIIKFKESVKLLTRRRRPIKPKEMVVRLNWTIRGWGNYFAIANVNTLYKELDVWIRMRVRCFVERKKSRFAHIRIPNYKIQSEYKLKSLTTLIKPHSL